jgi:hypothetical protein
MRSRPYIGAVMSKSPPFFDPKDPAVWLPGYRAIVYAEGRGDAVVFSLCAVDDASALKAAREIAGTLAFEVWDGLYMLRRQDMTRRDEPAA